MAPRTIERESRRRSCPTTYVRRRCAKSASLNEPVTRAPSPATSGPGSTRFSTCRGAPRPPDWIDVQESREVEATLRRLIEPGVADMEEADTASTQEVADPEPADAGAVEEESPTQPIPRVKMPSQPSSTQELVDSVASDPSPVDAQKVDEEKVDPAAGDTGQVVGHKELTEDELDGAQNYRTRVEEAQLPDDVREAALREVGKLERTSDQSPESDDIRTWLDTMLDLPWSTKIAGSIDIQESREVEATLRGLIKPAVADVEEGDTAEVEPVVADLEEGDTANRSIRQKSTL